MTLLVQPCVGPNATLVSTANASGGNQFTATNQGTGATHNWDNGQTIHGNATSLLRTLPASTLSSAYEEWGTSVVPNTANAYCRMYVYVTAAPTVNTRLAQLDLAAGTLCASIPYITTGVLRISDTGGATIAATTATLPLNQWVRVEFELTGISGTSGTGAIRFYSGANLETATPDSGASASASSANISGQVGNVRWGTFSGVTETAIISMRMSDAAYSDVSQPGPLVTAAVVPDLAMAPMTGA